MLENLIEVTENCRHSLMCRHVCPVGNLTRRESLTPHGWAQLIALERRGLTSWNDETVDALYSCADCGSCRAHCVSGQQLPEAIAAARADVAAQEKAPAVVYELKEKLLEWENPYAEVRPKNVDASGDAALFVGDETWHLRRSVLESALKLLEAAGIEPVLIGVGRNTGFLASSLGFPDVATDLVLATLAELESTGASRLFALCPGDYFALGQMIDERLGLALPGDVRLVGVLPFMAEQLAAGRLSFDGLDDETSYAYIDPTHAVRVPSHQDAPRRLLKAVLPGAHREVSWRNGRAYPCGNLALEHTQPRIADALTRARLEDAVRAGAAGVISEEAGSLVHLERHAPDFDLRVRGLYELLAGQLAA